MLADSPQQNRLVLLEKKRLLSYKDAFSSSDARRKEAKKEPGKRLEPDQAIKDFLDKKR